MGKLEEISRPLEGGCMREAVNNPLCLRLTATPKAREKSGPQKRAPDR